MKKTGLLINGIFFECDLKNLKIDIQGDVGDLSVESNFINQSISIVGNGNIQICNGNSTLLNNSNINIHINGNVNNIKTKTGNVYCNQSGIAESTSGDIKINGNVLADVKSVSGDITVNGDIQGNVNTSTGDINISKKR
ncbi:hypothetical protein ACFGZ5_11815 [Pasteurella multocida]|uniref:hypothetical protein n=1 Tax=Pasteurella multocida TaxID=747 RepID=UPI002FE0DF58